MLSNNVDKYNRKIKNISVFLTYVIVAILIPHLMFEYDPTAVMTYCILFGPISFIILGMITPLYNKNMLHSFIAGALAIIPTLIYFELFTKTIMYVWEGIFYLFFILFYCLIFRIIRKHHN